MNSKKTTVKDDPHTLNEFLLDRENGLYVEEYFRELLHLERRRSERSRKPFLLMLMDLCGLPDNGARTETVKKATSFLKDSKRETDMMGWYSPESVIGVIFPDTGAAEVASVKKRVLDGLNERKVPEGLSISFHAFPETLDGEKSSPDFETELYPDIVKKNSTNMLLIKRAMDVTGSILAIIAFMPIFALVSVLIKATSRGPVLFRQKRVGTLGRPFTMLKFRSMHTNNDERVHAEYVKKLIREQKAYTCEGEGVKTYKIKDDSRVTAIGNFLRKTSLDELPQFFNVLRGEMSLVGPRPPIPYELENYELWHLRRVLEVKPGITGLWQIRGRSRTTFDEMVRMDIKYIREWSLWLDLKLLLQTPWSVLTSRGAY